MKKLFNSLKLISLLAFTLCSFQSFAQNNHSGCGTDMIRDGLMKKDPNYLSKENQINQAISKLTVKKSNSRIAAASTCVIPVVFHIVNNSNETSDAFMTDLELRNRINNTLNWVNAAYAGAAPYGGVNTNIKFVLAQQTKNMNYTPGYTRLSNSLSNLYAVNDKLANDDDALINAILAQNGGSEANFYFPHEKYLNIIIVNDIKEIDGGTPAGYAYMPLNSSIVNDVIVIKKQYFGTTTSDNVCMIHEIGHYLGLYHTFNTSSGTLGCTNNDCLVDGDMVCDTPPDATNSPGTSCDVTQNSCNTDAIVDPNHKNPFTSDVPDLVNNYMDYGNPSCKNAFTQGQSDRMNLQLTNSRTLLCGSIGTVSLCVKPLLNFDFTVTKGITAVENVTITPSMTFVNASDTKVGYYYEVDYGDGSNLQTYDASLVNSFTHTYTSAKSYTIVVYLKYKPVGAATYSPECTRIVSQDFQSSCTTIPTFTASKYNASLNDNVVFTNTTNCPSGSTCSYNWYLDGDNFSTSSTTASKTFTTATVSQVQLEVIANGCGMKSSPSTIQVGGNTCPDMRYSRWQCDNKIYHFDGGVLKSESAKIVMDEANSIFSNSDGLPILICNGSSIYGSDYKEIIGGTKIWDTHFTSSDQGALVLQNPDPLKSNLFYAFSLPTTYGDNNGVGTPSGGLSYVIVDMNQGNISSVTNKPMGKVISSSPVTLFSIAPEKMVAIQKADGSAYYLVSHEFGTNNFVTFTIDKNGVNPTPTKTALGSVLPNTSYNARTNMKISQQGDKLVHCLANKIEVFNFNSLTGLPTSLYTTIDFSGNSIYNAEFSPDGKYLYANMTGLSYGLYQIDLTTSQKIFLSGTVNIGHMFLMSNGQIQINTNYNNIWYITVPNALGLNCGLVKDVTSSSYGISEVPIVLSPKIQYDITGNNCVGTNSTNVYGLNFTPKPSTTFKWTIVQGIPPVASISGADNLANVTLKFSTTGSPIELKCVISDPCGVYTVSKKINPYPNPVLTVSPTTLCAGGHVGYSYTYDASLTPTLTTPAGTQSGNFRTSFPYGENADVIVNQSGSFVLTLTDANGCSNSVSVPVTVSTPPVPTLTVSPTTVCAGAHVGYSYTYDASFTPTLSTPSGTQSGNFRVSYPYGENGDLIVNQSGSFVLTLTDVNGCSNSKSIPVTVNPLPTIGTISGNSTVCVGGTIALSCTPTGGTWSSSNPNFATVNSSGLVTGKIPQTPIIYYTYSNGICSATASKTMQVISVPTVGNSFATPIVISNNITCGFTYSNSNNTSNCFSNKYGQSSADVIYSFTITAPRKLKISTCGSGFDTWLNVLDINKNLLASNDDNGALCTGSSASLNYNFAIAGTYYIVLEGWTTKTGSYTLDVSVDPTSNCSATRLGDITSEENTLIVFPNPAQDYIQVNKPGTKVIYNSLGVEMIRSENDLIDINTLPTGIYIINVTNDGIVERATFVKN